MKTISSVLLCTLLLMACSKPPAKIEINSADYQVQSATQLQQRFDALNAKLASDFVRFKQVESNAFSHPFALDVHNLQTLNQHVPAGSSLKSTKVAYCTLMNDYFAQMYHLGHYNLHLVAQIQLPNTKNEDLNANFSSADQFYHFILDRYTSYRQVQQMMGYGCNLKAAL